MRLALVLCALLLLAPATALARYPVISYIDENGVFRLYDAEFGSELDPPPVPANFLGFRYAISPDGRYIVFNDDPAPRKLHLLDRATNTQVPLPGIDVYTNPGGLTVSNNGLIGFDDNGNGPALVYSSATGQFVETGLAASNDRREPRLSGDGVFLGTIDAGPDAYLQNLVTKTDTGFPKDLLVEEEHPCINGDGSRFGFDKRPGIGLPFDVYVYDRSAPTPLALSLPGMNDPVKDETNCVLDADGAYVGLTYDQSGAATFRVFQVASGEFLTLPPDKEFDSRSLFSAPFQAPPPGGGGGGAAAPPPSGDRTKPEVRRLRMTHRRFRPGRRATAFRFRLSEPARVRIVIRRRGRLAGTIRRRGLGAGANSISFNGRLRRRNLRPGPYDAVLIATDAAGNRSIPRLIGFRVLRPEGDRRP